MAPTLRVATPTVTAGQDLQVSGKEFRASCVEGAGVTISPRAEVPLTLTGGSLSTPVSVGVAHPQGSDAAFSLEVRVPEGLQGDYMLAAEGASAIEIHVKRPASS